MSAGHRNHYVLITLIMFSVQKSNKDFIQQTSCVLRHVTLTHDNHESIDCTFLYTYFVSYWSNQISFTLI